MIPPCCMSPLPACFLGANGEIVQLVPGVLIYDAKGGRHSRYTTCTLQEDIVLTLVVDKKLQS